MTPTRELRLHTENVHFPCENAGMFTGIITAVGQIGSMQPLGYSDAFGQRVAVDCPAGYLAEVALGDSIAINGACMTVATLDRQAQRFCVDMSAESLARTAPLRRDQRVNLEQALRAQDRLGGHLVSGHVDGVGRIVSLKPHGESVELRVEADSALARYLAYKGSVCVNGASLTINAVQDLPHACVVLINLIPHTLANTALSELAADSVVNLEIDLIARYVERMLTPMAPRS